MGLAELAVADSPKLPKRMLIQNPDSRRSAEILSGREAARARRLRVERDVRGSAGCAWAEQVAKLVK